VVRFIQGYPQFHHSIERKQFPVHLSWKLYVYFEQFLRYSELILKVANFPTPVAVLVRPWGVPYWNITKTLGDGKLHSPSASSDVVCVTTRLTVFIENQFVTYTRTDTHTLSHTLGHGIYCASIAYVAR